MKFDPTSDDQSERKEYPLPAPGKYRFGVGYSKDKISKSGNEMVQVKLDLLNNNGDVIGECWDYLGPLPYRVVHFCKSTGMTQCLAAGEFTAADCKGRQGWCEIEHETSDRYPTKAKVRDYLYKKDPTPPPSDDDLNF